MGSSLSKIRDDIEDYESLCRRYGEKARYSNGSADCYGEHAKALKERARRDAPAREVMES